MWVVPVVRKPATGSGSGFGSAVRDGPEFALATGVGSSCFASPAEDPGPGTLNVPRSLLAMGWRWLLGNHDETNSATRAAPPITASARRVG